MQNWNMSTKTVIQRCDTNLFQMLPDHLAMEMLLKEDSKKMENIPIRHAYQVKDEQQQQLLSLRSKLNDIRNIEITTYENLRKKVGKHVTRTIDRAKDIEATFLRTIKDELQLSLQQMDKMDTYLQHISAELCFMSNYAMGQHEKQIADLLTLNQGHINQIDAELTDLLSSLQDHMNVVSAELSKRTDISQIPTIPCKESLDLLRQESSEVKYSKLVNVHPPKTVNMVHESISCGSELEEESSHYVTLDQIEYQCRKSLGTLFDSLDFDSCNRDLEADIQAILHRNSSGVNLAHSEGTFVWKIDKVNLPILQDPTDLMFLPNGHLIVTDPAAKVMYEADLVGNIVRTRTCSNICPFGVTLTQDDFFVITDSTERNLKAFTRGGDLVCTFAKGYFSNPTHICSKCEDTYVVMDKKNTWKQEVYIYNMMQGSKVQLGKKTKDSLPFQRIHNPSFVTLDMWDNVYVSDQGSHAIKVFKLKSGAFVRHFGQQGNVKSDLSYPMGLATDVHGHILVADSGNHRLSVFTSNGQFVKNLLTQYDGIEYPQAISLSKTGQLAVIQKGSVYVYMLQ